MVKLNDIPVERIRVKTNELFNLPDEFKCPVCGEILKLIIGIHGTLMISCNNGWGESHGSPLCYSPWREKGNDIPYHLWWNHYHGDLLPQMSNSEHIYEDEENKRFVFADEIDLNLKNNYPDIFDEILYYEELLKKIYHDEKMRLVRKNG